MKMIARILIVIVLLATGECLYGQDMQFTQFYAAPTYLNPAFTGANACSRLSTNYRNQWPSIPGGFVSQIVSYDHFVNSLNSGFGFLFTKDKAGSGSLRQTNFSLLYAHEVKLTRKLSLRTGFQPTLNIRDMNFYDLVFGDQLTRDDAPVTVEPSLQPRIMYFDVSTGALFFTRKFWLGFSFHHLNMPNQTLMQGESVVPLKMSMHGGTKIAVKKTSSGEVLQSFTPAFNYRSQGKFDQLDIGVYYSYRIFDAGTWYRGLPGVKAYQPGYQNNDAIAMMAGVTIDRFKFAYSYDMTISRLVNNTGGAHELSLSYQFCKLKSNKRRRANTLLVPCPKF